MNHREDEALRQRLASENLSAAQRGESARMAAEQCERDSNPIPLSRAPREVPRPEPMWRQPPVPTSSSYASAMAKRALAWLVLGISAVLTGAGAVWWWQS